LISYFLNINWNSCIFIEHSAQITACNTFQAHEPTLPPIRTPAVLDDPRVSSLSHQHHTVAGGVCRALGQSEFSCFLLDPGVTSLYSNGDWPILEVCQIRVLCCIHSGIRDYAKYLLACVNMTFGTDASVGLVCFLLKLYQFKVLVGIGDVASTAALGKPVAVHYLLFG